MKKNNKHFILFSVGLGLLTIAFIAYYMYNKGPINIEEGSAINVDPVTLYNTYRTDSIRAHKIYDGQIVRLKGEISGVSENTQKEQVILIKTSAAGGYINCTMAKPISGVIAGSKIAVKGICNGIGQADEELGITADVYLTRVIPE